MKLFNFPSFQTSSESTKCKDFCSILSPTLTTTALSHGSSMASMQKKIKFMSFTMSLMLNEFVQTYTFNTTLNVLSNCKYIDIFAFSHCLKLWPYLLDTLVKATIVKMTWSDDNKWKLFVPFKRCVCVWYAGLRQELCSRALINYVLSIFFYPI